MSEFSDSYHLRSENQLDGVKLLKRAWLRGFVFPPINGWVTVVPSGQKLVPNKRLINSNTGILFHLVHAEDHGWYFSIYENSKKTCHYECWWEEDIAIDHELYERSRLMELIEQNDHVIDKAGSVEITALIYPNDIEEIFEEYPAYKLAKKLGLTNYEWIAYDYLVSEYDSGDRQQLEGVEFVKPWYLFF